MTPSTTHLVLMPTYNTGARLTEVATEALRHWRPVFVVVDGSTDGSQRPLLAMADHEPGLRVLTLHRNCGKGAAVLAGLRAAVESGFTHALVMDADGQHPAGSIDEFMAASQRQPRAMILGRPIFGPEVPRERLYGHKLSVGLVCFETLGSTIADPLFGFRVYPARLLLELLGPRRGGRRYDFDTEAAVRLCWAGVPSVNLAAPVRYFQPTEGGVSHFRYGRDNLKLIWLHTRLIAEFLLYRLPVRLWRACSTASFKTVLIVVLVLGGWCRAPLARAQGDGSSIVQPGHRLSLDPPDPAWRDLLTDIKRRTTVEAPFEERRWFPFRKKPVTLQGEVRIDATHGLSLHYEQPQEHIVIIDEAGLLVRQNGRDTTPPADPRARAANNAMLHVLRFDFAALAGTFELYGRRAGQVWDMVLVPRAPELIHTLGDIRVDGDGDRVRRIELRRSATERVEILVGDPRPPAPFSAEDMHRFFR